MHSRGKYWLDDVFDLLANFAKAENASEDLLLVACSAVLSCSLEFAFAGSLTLARVPGQQQQGVYKVWSALRPALESICEESLHKVCDEGEQIDSASAAAAALMVALKASAGDSSTAAPSTPESGGLYFGDSIGRLNLDDASQLQLVEYVSEASKTLIRQKSFRMYTDMVAERLDGFFSRRGIPHNEHGQVCAQLVEVLQEIFVGPLFSCLDKTWMGISAAVAQEVMSTSSIPAAAQEFFSTSEKVFAAASLRMSYLASGLSSMVSDTAIGQDPQRSITLPASDCPLRGLAHAAKLLAHRDVVKAFLPIDIKLTLKFANGVYSDDTACERETARLWAQLLVHLSKCATDVLACMSAVDFKKALCSIFDLEVRRSIGSATSSKKEVECKVEAHEDGDGDGEPQHKKRKMQITFDELYFFEDAEVTSDLKVLKHSADAHKLGGWPCEPRFMKVFNANVAAAPFVMGLQDVGTGKLEINIMEKEPVPVATEVTSSMRFHFVGTMSPTPAAGGFYAMTAFGVDYYIVGTAHKALTADVFYPAWMAKVVGDEENATFEVKKRGSCVNWPSDVDPPAFTTDNANATVIVERHVPPDEDEPERSIWWRYEIYYLAPKKKFIGATGIEVTYVQPEAQLTKAAVKDLTIAGDGGGKAYPAYHGYNGLRAKHVRMELQEGALGAGGAKSADQIKVEKQQKKEMQEALKRAKHLLK